MSEAEATFQALVETAPDAIIAVDDHGRIVLVNAQVEVLFGYSRDELIGESIEVLVPFSAREAHAGHRQRYFDHPTTRPMGLGMQLAGRRKDGSEFPAEISLSSIQTPQGLLASAAVRDVTDRIEAQRERERLRARAERERMEAQLHQSQRLESLGQLAGGVAHDFNNLLGVIVNYAVFVKEEVGREAEANPQRWEPVIADLAQVERAAARATELTHQLLAFGRREVVNPVPLDLNEVLAGVEPMLRRTLGEHLELRIVAGQRLPAVMADPGQIEQVLVNLAVNARDAMIGGGVLTIDTANLDVDDDYHSVDPAVPQGCYARLRVSDSGVGMPQDVLTRAFEPFFTTKPKGEGSGLGLATVYGIVNQAGGHASIYSEPGLGTTFTALFPATDQAPDAAGDRESETDLRGTETVLVVEDEPAMREVTRRILTRNGHTVLAAESGLQALAMLEHHPGEIDLLLTDVVMPKMLGKEVAEQVRALRPGIRVLFMSGYAQPMLATQGTLDDGVVLVQKPFSEAALMEAVRGVLDGA